MACERCPCPDICLARPRWCKWMAGEPTKIQSRHICERSRMEQRGPSLATQAASLGRSLWDWAVSGFSMAGAEEQARRKAICADCPQFDSGRCRICGCKLAFKIQMKTEHCPIDKW